MQIQTDILRLAAAAAGHAAIRQSLVAQNIANADTPGYKARDLASFAATYAGGEAGAPVSMKATRPAHLPGDARPLPAPEIIVTGGEAAPNGNDVSLESEMMRAVALRNQYDLALGVFRKSVDILRTSLGR